MIRISQIQLPVGHTKKQLESAICKKLRVSDNDIKSVKYSLVKMSLDARNKEKITYNYVVYPVTEIGSSAFTGGYIDRRFNNITRERQA